MARVASGIAAAMALALTACQRQGVTRPVATGPSASEAPGQTSSGASTAEESEPVVKADGQSASAPVEDAEIPQERKTEDVPSPAARISASPARAPWQRMGPPEDFQGVGVDEAFLEEAGAAGEGEPEDADRTTGAAGGAFLEAEGRTRPDWWLAAPARSADGRLRLTAEALGADVLEARRNAVRAGRRALRRIMGADIEQERVELATVRRLPRQNEAPGSARYVGYILISARTRAGN